MTDIKPVLPRTAVPHLDLQLAPDGTAFSLADEKPQHFTLVVVYRGLHCPICKVQLRDLESRLDAFAEKGVGVIALSTDTEERAARAKTDWGLPRLRLGYGFSLNAARRWGLFLSAGRGTTSIGVEEPALFAEPGLFLVRRTARSTSLASRRCPLRGRPSPIFWARSTSSSPRIIRLVARWRRSMTVCCVLMTVTRRTLMLSSAAGAFGTLPSADVVAAEAYPPPFSTPHAQFTVLDPREVAAHVSLRDLEGRRRTLAAYRGKAVLLAFWASWCPPCRRELPILHRLQTQAKSEPFVVVPVSLDRDAATAAAYIRRLRLDGFSSFIDTEGRGRIGSKVEGRDALSPLWHADELRDRCAGSQRRLSDRRSRLERAGCTRLTALLRPVLGVSGGTSACLYDPKGRRGWPRVSSFQ